MSGATVRTFLLSGLGLLGLLLGCRALTEPGLRPEPSTSATVIEGQVLLPDGSPSPGGSLLVDNRIYEDERDDWIQARVALDEDGHFSTMLRLGELTDLTFEPPAFLEMPSHRFLGVRTQDLPWQLRHPMRQVARSVDAPDSILEGLEDGVLYLRQSRPRPAGENAYAENYIVPIDATATARGWILPGAHEVEMILRGVNDLRFEFPDSVASPVDSIPSLRPWLRGQTVEIVLPEGIPPAGTFELYVRQNLVGETSGGRIYSFVHLSRDEPRRWATLPRDIQRVEVSSLGFQIGTSLRLLTHTFFEIEDGVLAPVRVGEFWLEIRAPAGSDEEVYDRVKLYVGSDNAEASMIGGRALFILDDGSYLIEVRDAEDQLVGRRIYEATQSGTLTLDF